MTAVANDATTRAIANPILRGMQPDPSICRVDGTYYVATSTFEYLPGIPIHASTDLETWTLVGHAIHDPAQFDYRAVPDSRGIFAPTIRHHDGLFYIACTLMDAGDAGGSFYVTAVDPAGPWSQPVMLPDARGIDPSIHFTGGKVWWTGCREVLDPDFDGETEVWLRELDLERGELVGDETVIWTRTQYRAVWAEAPHILERDGWFYLVTAEGGTAFEHSVMVARSRSIDGPYLPCPRNPVLTHRHLGSRVDVQYVGHADLVEGDDGEWWLVALAVRPIDGHHILGRETHLARVEWEGGWPVVNPGLGRLDAPVERAASHGSDGVPRLEDFTAIRGFASAVATEPADGEPGIRLSSTGDTFGSGAPVAELLRRLTSVDSRVEIALDVSEEAATGGLVLRQSDDFLVRIEVTAPESGGEVRVALVTRQGGADAIVALVAFPAGHVVLSADITRDGVAWAAASRGGTAVDLGRTPLSLLSTETAGGFVGTLFGPYSIGSDGSGVMFTAWSQEDRIS